MGRGTKQKFKENKLIADWHMIILSQVLLEVKVLASHSKPHLNIIYLIMFLARNMYYIGGLTLDDHDSWMWYTTGAPISKSGKWWAMGEPNDWLESSEYCLSMDYR